MTSYQLSRKIISWISLIPIRMRISDDSCHKSTVNMAETPLGMFSRGLLELFSILKFYRLAATSSASNSTTENLTDCSPATIFGQHSSERQSIRRIRFYVFQSAV